MQLTLPSGLVIVPPTDPHTWVEQAGVVYGDALSAKTLEADVAAAIAWHRQRPIVQAIATAVTSLPASTFTPIPLAYELIDTAAGHNDVTNTSRWYAPDTINTTDWYLAVGQVAIAGTDPTKNYAIGLRVDGATIYEGSTIPGTTGHNCTGLVVDLVQMTSNGNHYLELLGRQTTAAAVNTVVNPSTSVLSVRWVCAGTGTVVALPANPRTWADADLLTASTAGAGKAPLNTHIRDVIRYLNYPAIARVTAETSLQSIPTGVGTWTSVQFPTVTVDNHTMWATGTNTRLTCVRAGLYDVFGLGGLAESAAATGYRGVRIRHTIAAGGTALYGGTTTMAATSSSTGTKLPARAKIRMAVGDYVELQLDHNEVGALTIKAGASDCARLCAVWRSL